MNKKLSHDVFAINITYLNEFYTNFKFDTTNVTKMTIWYDFFKEFNNDDFTDLIKAYCRENIYAPQSPTHLIDFANNRMFENEKPKIEQAWQYLMKAVGKYGLGNKTRYISELATFKTFNELEQVLQKHDDPLIYEIYTLIKSKLYTMTTDNEPYVRNDFFKEYETLLKREIKNKVMNGKLIANIQQKQIGE